MKIHIVYPPHAKWIRECCDINLWPKVRSMTKDLMKTGEAGPDSMRYIDYAVQEFRNVLAVAQAEDGLIMVAPPQGMTVEEFAERVKEVCHG